MICPIDTGRYGSEEIRKIFDEENKLQRMLDVEAALAKALADLGEIPREAAEVIAKNADTKIVTIEKVKEKEKKTRHDIVAVVEVLAEACGEYGEYVHWGATSYDIVDTAWALIFKDALGIIERELLELMEQLRKKAEDYSDLVMPGRTHGQHAIPVTLGFKFAVYLSEFVRHLERLKQMKERVLVGKMSGAVGTMASFSGTGIEVEKRVMEYLGLRPAEISTQIVCRDRFAELVLWCALVGSSLDRIATEIRNLQRTEILEVAEGFEIREQVGSSTMPHKQNPISCERISGLAKVLRGLIIPALENIPLWHERDLTNSSSERFILPMSMIILEEMLRSMINVVRTLRVFPENMKRNLELTQGRTMAEAVMMALARKGMGRRKAHKLLRRLSIKSFLEKRPFKEVLIENDEIRKFLTEEEINELLKPENYLGRTKDLIGRVIETYDRVIKG